MKKMIRLSVILCLIYALSACKQEDRDKVVKDKLKVLDQEWNRTDDSLSEAVVMEKVYSYNLKPARDSILRIYYSHKIDSLKERLIALKIERDSIKKELKDDK